MAYCIDEENWERYVCGHPFPPAALVISRSLRTNTPRISVLSLHLVPVLSNFVFDIIHIHKYT